jgi:uridine phosphorylase
MSRFILFLAAVFGIFQTITLSANETNEREIYLTLEDCLFVKMPVPEKGIVCSNYERALRLSEKLTNAQTHKCSWGPFVVIGEYKNEKVFVACASVGTGSGLVFTELFVAGAKYIIRYGSDDVKMPPESDAYLVKIVDEADNLYGFNLQSGVAPEEWGKSVFASTEIIESLISTAEKNQINHEMRVCHHLENYHGLRSPDKFSPDRSKRLNDILEELKKNPKPASFDMETAVLFRVAKDFGLHAATILQTVNKEKTKQTMPKEQFQEIRKIEEEIFFPYVLDALINI